jgi:hypothetical protein
MNSTKVTTDKPDKASSSETPGLPPTAAHRVVAVPVPESDLEQLLSPSHPPPQALSSFKNSSVRLILQP